MFFIFESERWQFYVLLLVKDTKYRLEAEKAWP